MQDFKVVLKQAFLILTYQMDFETDFVSKGKKVAYTP